MKELLQISDAALAFGGVRALDGVTIAVPEGELFGLIGPNGSGKTTLINVISRLTRLGAGGLRISGVDYTMAPAHVVNELGIARTFQNIRLLGGTSVLDNVMLGATVSIARRAPWLNWLRLGSAISAQRQARKRALAALERVGMAEFALAYPEELPYGRQRKVEIARALACDPHLLLLDEPASGMTYSERIELGDLLEALHRDGLTQVLVEHDLEMIHRLCSRAVVLNFGKVIADGSPAEVARDPAVREAYLGHGTQAASESNVVA